MGHVSNKFFLNKYVFDFNQINDALSLDHTRRQWVNLGILQACIISPETCGEAGGAIAFWIKINYYPTSRVFLGFVASTDYRSRVWIGLVKNSDMV